MPYLHMEMPDGSKEQFEVLGDQLVLGRSDEADLVIADGRISRRHCVIERLPGDSSQSQWVLRDLGSSNKTYVNKEPITKHELTDGDVFKIGDVRIQFDLAARQRSAGTAADSAPAAASSVSADRQRDATLDEMAVTDEHQCPSCQADLPADAVLCVQCGFNLKTGQRLNVQTDTAPDKPKKKFSLPTRKKSASQAAVPSAAATAVDDPAASARAAVSTHTDEAILDEHTTHNVREIYVPSALAVAGGLCVVVATIQTGNVLMPVGALVMTVVSSIFLLISMQLAARIGDIDFGNIGTALLKVFGTCLLITGTRFVAGFELGLMLDMGLIFVVYGFALWYLFYCDFFELSLVLVAMCLLNFLIVPVIAAVLLGALGII